eukprot:3382111-Pyramimonas_sp.AAC.1
MPVAGQAETTGGERPDPMPLDFTAVCGSQTQQMLEGTIAIDLPDGQMNPQRDDGTLRVTTTTQEAIAVAAQYVTEHMCHNPGTGAVDRSRLTGELTHVVPADVTETI